MESPPMITNTTTGEAIAPTGVQSFPDPTKWTRAFTSMLLVFLLGAATVALPFAMNALGLVIGGAGLTLAMAVGSKGLPRGVWMTGVVAFGVHAGCALALHVGGAAVFDEVPVLLIGLIGGGIFGIGSILAAHRVIATSGASPAWRTHAGMALVWLGVGALGAIVAPLIGSLWPLVVGACLALLAMVAAVVGSLIAAVQARKLARDFPLFAAMGISADGSTAKTSTRGRGLVRLFRVLAVLIPVASGALGWLWFGPVAFDTAAWDAATTAVARDIPPPEQNGWTDLASISNVVDAALADRIDDAWKRFEAGPVAWKADDNLASLLTAHAPAMENWDSARQVPVAAWVGPTTPDANDPALRLTPSLRLRLIATIDTPADFLITVADANLAIQTLSGATSPIANAVAATIARSVVVALSAHLVRQQLDNAALLSLDRVLDSAIHNFGNPSGAVLAELVQFDQWRRAGKLSPFPVQSSLVRGLIGDYYTSRTNRVTEGLLPILTEARTIDDTAFRDFVQAHPYSPGTTLGGDAYRFGGLSPVSNFATDIPTWEPFAMRVRHARTGLRMMRVALRLVVYFNRVRTLPEALADLPGGKDTPWSADGLITDAWSAGGKEPYIYEPVLSSEPQPHPTFRLASRGLNGISDLIKLAADSPDLIVNVPPAKQPR
ncbi:MAG: hypothetical protein AB7S36_19000 [Planctomycetota bacterium]